MWYEITYPFPNVPCAAIHSCFTITGEVVCDNCHCPSANAVSLKNMSMTYLKTVVSPVIMHWRYTSVFHKVITVNIILGVYYVSIIGNYHCEKMNLPTTNNLRRLLTSSPPSYFITLYYRWLGAVVLHCSNSSALALELLQSCAKPSICMLRNVIHATPATNEPS